MKINNIKINSYGKIKNKEIKLNNKLNIISGKNESGKSTVLNFIFNILYGASKLKNGKEISDYEKYKPWDTDEFSGKLIYELDNKEKYEIYREFDKKSPKIFNQNGEEISSEFRTDKKNGSTFFYDQTHIDSKMFLATSISMQQEVKIGKNIRNSMIEKISNLLRTGEDNISYQETLDELNKIQLETIGTNRSKDKPINIAKRKFEENEERINELKQYQKNQSENIENIIDIKSEIKDDEDQMVLLKQIKDVYEKDKTNNEVIKIKEKIIEENNAKKIILNRNIKEKNESFEEIKNNKKVKNKKEIKKKKQKKLRIIFLIIIILEIAWIFGIPYFTSNKIVSKIGYVFLPIYILIYILKVKKLNKKINEFEEKNSNNIKDYKEEIEKLENELTALNNNTNLLEDEIKKDKNRNVFLFNLQKQQIMNKNYIKYTQEEINQLFNNREIDKKIEILQNKLDNSKYELNKLELIKENIEKQLEILSDLEEQQEIIEQEIDNLNKENESIELAKKLLEKAYQKMKNDVSPTFSEQLSKNISRITDNKYSKILFNDEQGLVVELNNGNYVPAERLSVGTIDQIYLSLRLAMLDEVSDEKVPIILDEAFAFFDEERLRNILIFLSKEYSERQIIIFTCTNRETKILEKARINFNLIEI